MINKNLLFDRLLRVLPNFLWLLKREIIKFLIKQKGNNLIISSDSVILEFSNITIGDNVFINRNFYCSAIMGVLIGDRVMFGANISIIGGNHKFNNYEESLRFPSQLGDNQKIIIESDAWIGHGTTILKGAMIGEGTIVGAASLVNKILLPYSVYAGNPIRFIKPRFNTEEELMLHLTFLNKKYSFTTKYCRAELSIIYEKNK